MIAIGHPSLAIKSIYLEPNGIGSNKFAKMLGVSKSLTSIFLNQRCGISPKLAIRLSLVLGGTAEDWLKKQRDYELSEELKNTDIQDLKSKIIKMECSNER